MLPLDTLPPETSDTPGLILTPQGQQAPLSGAPTLPISPASNAAATTGTSPAWAKVLALGLGGVADFFNRLSGQATNVAGEASKTILGLEAEGRKAKAEERRAATEEQRVQLETLKTWSALRKDQFDLSKAALAGIIDFSKNSPFATDAERTKAAEAFQKQAAEAGAPIPVEVFHGIARNPALRDVAGSLFPYLDDPTSAGLVMANVATMLRNSQGDKVVPYLQGLAAPAISADLFRAVPGVVASLRRLPEFQGKDIPFETVVSVVEAIPEKGRALASALRGELGQPTEIYTRLLDIVIPRGVGRPDIAGAAAKAGAVKGATERAGLEPDIVAGKAAEERQKKLAGLAPEVIAGEQRLAEARERGQLDARESFQMPPLAPPVLNELAAQKIDPRKATEEQIRAAQKAADTRETDLQTERAEARQKAITRVENAMAGQKPATPEEVDRLRDDFTTASKVFVTVRDAYARILASSREPSAAGDLSLIYNYMKLLDPGSVVRESEFGLAASSGSFGERIGALVQRAMKGERMTDAVRTDFTTRARKLFAEQLTLHEELEGQFRGLARRRKIDEARVVTDLPGKLRGAVREAEKPAAGTTPDARAREKYGLPPRPGR